MANTQPSLTSRLIGNPYIHVTNTLYSSLKRYQRLMCCSPQVQEQTP